MTSPFDSNHPSRRNLLTGATLALASMSLYGCGASSPSASTTGSNPSATGLKAVKIGYFPLVHTSTIVNAHESGFLKENGIDAELIQTQGGAAAIPALVSGSIDIVYSNYTSALLAAQKGLPLVLIAGNDIGAADHGIYVDPASGIKTIADLKGKSFAVNNLQNIGTVALYSQLENAGLSISDINIVEMPYPDMASAVESGNVHAIWQVEPFQAIASKAGLVKIGNMFTGETENVPVAGWVTTRTYAQENPQVINGLKKALAKSMEGLSGNRAALKKLIPTYTKVSADVVEGIELPTFSADLDLKKMQAGADLMLKYKLISESLNVTSVAYQA